MSHDQILELLNRRASDRLVRELTGTIGGRRHDDPPSTNGPGNGRGAYEFDLDAAILAPIIEVHA